MLLHHFFISSSLSSIPLHHYFISSSLPLHHFFITWRSRRRRWWLCWSCTSTTFELLVVHAHSTENSCFAPAQYPVVHNPENSFCADTQLQLWTTPYAQLEFCMCTGYFRVVHVHNINLQCCACAQRYIWELYIHVHEWIFRSCACAQLDISEFCMCTTLNFCVVHVHNCSCACAK